MVVLLLGAEPGAPVPIVFYYRKGSSNVSSAGPPGSHCLLIFIFIHIFIHSFQIKELHSEEGSRAVKAALPLWFRCSAALAGL